MFLIKKLLLYNKLIFQYRYSSIINNLMQDPQKNLIQLDRFVLLTDNRKEQRLLKPNDNKNFKWRKINIKLQDLQKFQYFQHIQVGNGQLSRSQDQYEQQSQLDEQQQEEQVLNSNNKQIYTLQAAQKLNAQQINQLKATKNANEIISTLVSNNEQFQKRTAYSKQKYLAKKKRKYMFKFHAQKPNIENVHNYYFNSDPKNIGFIRWDMLGFMLLQGSPFKNVLVAEKTKGILLASLIQRSAKKITVCSDEVKNIKRFPIVQQMNISKQKSQKIVVFQQWKSVALKIDSKQITGQFTNLIMLGNYNFKQIVQKLQPGLAPGCIICLHCQNLEPQQQVICLMKSKQNFIHIKLYDMWARQYQVLKNRTHPLMYMPSHSGYLVTAIKVD